MKTREVLKIIAAGALVVSIPAMPALGAVLVTAIKAFKEANKSDVGRIVKRLNKQNLISIKEENGKTIIKITEKGKQKVLRDSFDNISLKAKRRDGKWRLILFDIPENKKKNRDLLRKKLLDLGFERLQDSVFVSAFPCKEEVDFISNYLQVSDYVSVISVNKVERGESLFFKSYRGD